MMNVSETDSAYDSVVASVKLHEGHVVGPLNIQEMGLAISPFPARSRGGRPERKTPGKGRSESKNCLYGAGGARESGPQMTPVHWPPQRGVEIPPGYSWTFRPKPNKSCAIEGNASSFRKQDVELPYAFLGISWLA